MLFPSPKVRRGVEGEGQSPAGFDGRIPDNMKHKPSQPIRQIGQITVGDVVRFLLWLPDEEREQAIELLRAIQDRRWREIWHEPIILGEAE